MGKKVSVYTSVHRTVSYQLLDHHPLEGDTETPTDGRHGTSVSLSRRVMTHHLSARTDRFFVCGVCVCIYLARTHVLDRRYRPSTHRTLARSRRPSTATVEGRRRRRRHSTTREEEERRSGDERRREDRLDRIRASVRGSNRTHRTHRTNRTNPSNPSVGRLTIDPSNRIHSFARSFRFIHRSESEEERRRREV